MNPSSDDAAITFSLPDKYEIIHSIGRIKNNDVLAQSCLNHCSEKMSRSFPAESAVMIKII